MRRGRDPFRLCACQRERVVEPYRGTLDEDGRARVRESPCDEIENIGAATERERERLVADRRCRETPAAGARDLRIVFRAVGVEVLLRGRGRREEIGTRLDDERSATQAGIDGPVPRDPPAEAPEARGVTAEEQRNAHSCLPVPDRANTIAR